MTLDEQAAAYDTAKTVPCWPMREKDHAMKRVLLVVLAVLLALTGIIIAWRQWPTSWPTVAEEWWRSLRSPPPTLAKDISCVVLDTVDLSVPCKVSYGRVCETPLPHYEVIGKYADKAEARRALKTTTVCKRDIVYIVWDMTIGLCRIWVSDDPEERFLDNGDDNDRYSELGHYASQAEAVKAMHTKEVCAANFNYYVMRDMQTGSCKVMIPKPNNGNYEDMGLYHSAGEAEEAMNALELCKHNAPTNDAAHDWQTPEVLDKMANEMSVCAAYYEHVSIARPGEAQWGFFRKKALGYAALQAEMAGLKPETAAPPYKMALDDMSRRIDKNPTNISILIADYDNLCNEAMVFPEKRGRYWLERLTTPPQ